MFEVPLHGAREDHALQVAALLDERGKLVVLRDAGDVLLDDGAFVEGFGDVMAGCADELDAAFEGRVVGFAPVKAGRNEWWTLMMRRGYAATNLGDRTCM